MLVDTFDLLKGNYNNNSCSLMYIVGKMAKMDCSTAIEMWKYLIKNNLDDLYSNDDFGFKFMYDIEEAIGEEKTYRLIVEDDYLREHIYGQCGDLQLCPLYAIKFLISTNDLSDAENLMQLVLSNKHRNNSIFEILYSIIPNSNIEITEEAFELLEEWIKQVENSEEKAKLNLRMLDFVDEVDGDE